MTTTAAAGPPKQDEPRVLGPYRLLGRLGRGGTGTVYLGAEPDGRRVAVKVVNRELAGEPEFLERFRRVVAYAFGLTGERFPPFRALPRERRTR